MPTKDSKTASKSDASPEITGQTSLPISRIKKIIQLDDDIVQCSSNATFVVAMATELFIQYLVEQGHNVVKSERKPRKTVQYRDLATAVSRIDNLEFLADVIPKTTTYKQFKQKQAKDSSKDAEIEKGQRTLNGAPPPIPDPSPEISLSKQEISLPRGSRPPTVTMLVEGDGNSPAEDNDVEMADQ